MLSIENDEATISATLKDKSGKFCLCVCVHKEPIRGDLLSAATTEDETLLHQATLVFVLLPTLWRQAVTIFHKKK